MRRPNRPRSASPRSEFYPHISLTGSLGWSSQDLNDLFVEESFNAAAGPSFTLEHPQLLPAPQQRSLSGRDVPRARDDVSADRAPSRRRSRERDRVVLEVAGPRQGPQRQRRRLARRHEPARNTVSRADDRLHAGRLLRPESARTAGPRHAGPRRRGARAGGDLPRARRRLADSARGGRRRAEGRHSAVPAGACKTSKEPCRSCRQPWRHGHRRCCRRRRPSRGSRSRTDATRFATRHTLSVVL